MANVGAPPKFESPEYLWGKFIEWKATFQASDQQGANTDIPDIEGFCDFVDAYRDIICEYEKKLDFSDTVKRIKNWIYYKKKQLAMQNKMNPAVFIFDAKNNAGYVDKTEQDVSHSGEVSFVNNVPRPSR